MSAILANLAISSLNGAILSTDLTLTIQTADASRFPSPGASDWFPLVLGSGVTQEIVRVTARAGAVLTIVRGQEGTTAQGWPSGTRADVRVTAGALSANHNATAAGLADGRLTLESGVPVSTSDQTAKTTLYYTPYLGNRLGLFDGATWLVRWFTELSLSLAGLTASKPHDIFSYDNAGVPTLEALVWTNDSTRATALVRQDGVLVKSGAPTRRYLGTIYTSATGQTQLKFGGSANGGSEAWLGIWNANNRVLAKAAVLDDTGYTYGTATWRAAHGSSTFRVSFIRGLNEDAVQARYDVNAGSASANQTPDVGIDLDSTTAQPAISTTSFQSAASSLVYQVSVPYDDMPAAGFHYLAAVQQCRNGVTVSFNGSSHPSDSLIAKLTY